MVIMIYICASKIIADNKFPISYSTHKTQLYVYYIELNYNFLPKQSDLYIKLYPWHSQSLEWR